MAFLTCPPILCKGCYTHFFQEPLLIRFHNFLNFGFSRGYDDEVDIEDDDDDCDAKVNCKADLKRINRCVIKPGIEGHSWTI